MLLFWHNWHPSQLARGVITICLSRCRHQMETGSALLALCVGNSLVTGEFPSQRQLARSFDVFFDLCLNKRLSKQSRGWWSETPSGSLWRHCNVYCVVNWFDKVLDQYHINELIKATGLSEVQMNISVLAGPPILTGHGRCRYRNLSCGC